MTVVELFKVRGKNLFVVNYECSHYWSVEIKYNADWMNKSFYTDRDTLSVEEYVNFINSIDPLLTNDIYNKFFLDSKYNFINLGDSSKFILFEGAPYEEQKLTFRSYKYKLRNIERQDGYLTKNEILKKLEIFKA